MDHTTSASSVLPDPPYSPETRAKGWRLESDIERIEQSDTWALATPLKLRGQLLLLWHECWKQNPVGTLPDDDTVISARIDMLIHEFRKHREVLLRGWRRHSDGRLYHPVVTEVVLRMIDKRADDRQRQADWRKKAKAESITEARAEAEPALEARAKRTNSQSVTRDSDVTPSESTVNPVPVPVPVPVPKKEQTHTSSSAPPNIDGFSLKPISDDLKAQAVDILNHLNDKSGRKFRPVDETLKPIVSRLKRGATVEEMLAVINAKVADWRDNDEMRKHLNPSTLFGPKHYENYLVQAGDASAALTLKEWARTIGESGQSEVLDELYDYADSAKIPQDWAHLTVWELHEREKLRQERRSDWRNHLQLALRSNSLRLWRANVDGSLALTEAGVAAESARNEATRKKAEARRQEQSAEAVVPPSACPLRGAHDSQIVSVG